MRPPDRFARDAAARVYKRATKILRAVFARGESVLMIGEKSE
jgi:hypothetical protein